MEADPRHAELIVEQLELEKERGLGAPGPTNSAEEDDEEGDIPLTGEAITGYRAIVARCNYLASDRPDCMFAIKEGCREMSAPITGSLRRLLRTGR